ncbi:alpha/beta fold hydrolase [Flavobacterium sp. HJJ]|uniref:alpha/beta fold hydrolase n=1 Tax=Flavobacterium sp. HJJ TaxID=2783792 RepID=UPI00188A0CCE|nr:alpha/beta fold hydrolase [Flavobacterium sp. HJJ]MBF4470376.1 alpha/beta fold hydrolase [Flavobacterium sp. HJJ]
MSLKKSIQFLFVKSVGQYINLLSFVHPKNALNLSYKLFTNPRVGKIQENQLPEILQGTIKEKFQHDENYFQTYTWEGNDTKILLVHGWESNSARWEKTLPYLQKSGSTIIAIDAPAHGQSSGKEFNVPRYVEFINKAVKKYSPSIIIGHSIGGSACVYHQYLHPETSIKKMVILGAPSDLKTLITNYIEMLSLNRKMFALLEKRYLENFNFRLEDFSGETFAKHIQIDGIIAHDTTDTVVAFSEGQKIASGWKKGKFITTKDLGHSMHDDKLYKEIYQFLFEK